MFAWNTTDLVAISDGLSFGEWVLMMRNRLGLTQKQLATACGYATDATVRRWEMNQNLPVTADKIQAIARAFHVKASEVMERLGVAPDDAEPELAPELAAYLATPQGRTATPAVREQIAAYEGRSRAFYRYLHAVLEEGVPVEQAARDADFLERATRRQ